MITLLEFYIVSNKIQLPSGAERLLSGRFITFLGLYAFEHSLELIWVPFDFLVPYSFQRNPFGVLGINH